MCDSVRLLFFFILLQVIRENPANCSRWPPCLSFSQRARLEMRPPMHHRCNGLVGPNRPHWALLARGRPAEGRPSSLAAPAAIAIQCLVVEHQLAEERSPRVPVVTMLIARNSVPRASQADLLDLSELLLCGHSSARRS